MATKCETYQINIAKLESDVTSATADFNAKKATAQNWINSFTNDYNNTRCGREVQYNPDVNAYLDSGSLSSANCRVKAIGDTCSKEGCQGRINNNINPALLSMQTAYKAMNKAITDLATEKENFANDADCRAQQQQTTQQEIRDAEKNRQLRNNIIIVIVAVVIVAIGIWAWIKYRKNKS